jgi:hypothetical protein
MYRTTSLAEVAYLKSLGHRYQPEPAGRRTVFVFPDVSGDAVADFYKSDANRVLQAYFDVLAEIRARAERMPAHAVSHATSPAR